MNRMLLAVRTFSPIQIFASSLENARARWRVAPPSAHNADAAQATDARLVAKHLAGDPHAFEELVKRYTGAVYNIAFRFTNNAADAEHVSQETFLRAWHALPRLVTNRPLKPYLLKIAVNLCRDWAEQNTVQTVDWDEQADHLFADDGGDPLENLTDRELQARVRAKLQGLPPLYRTVLALRYSEELTYEEMATALDLPLNTVRTHLHRAKARLRELLEQDE
jgi:RNA polymerase sigma-70 factor (ECF subfamily)